MVNRYSATAKKARKLTNKQLSDKLTQLSPLSEEKLKELLPNKRDKEEFTKLMDVVAKETAMDQQIAYLEGNIKTAGTVALKVLKYFV